ncbi:hypothetical protein QBC40DRAFT_82596 [Triangularia verruculosa]|uniref:Uncharacterized protein n=1 Tax=Triangularia verruculosa TaxID=2587418 RepID=A0AAN6XEW9_9PEZI|nr:hypothetical protein QBC40DRAFT_82596 [Triangularia verruculosa]
MPPPTTPRRQTSSSHSSSSQGSRNRRSNDSYGSNSTAPTSIYTSPGPSGLKRSPASTGSSGTSRSYDYRNDVSPTTSLDSRSSVETYASTTASSEDVATLDDKSLDYEYNSIPPLPVYRRELVEPNVRPSTPQDFAKLFPSLNRLTIRHDEFTSDGNMNLRIDTVVTGRRRTAIQLFHLRMYDLAKREFSLRRYSRDSGREVCNSKRKYIEPSAPSRPQSRDRDERPTLKRSMSTAIKSLGGGKPALRRAKSGMTSIGRPSTGYSMSDADDEIFNDRSNLSRLSLDHHKAQRPQPTNTIKLEFSNYARVDVHRRGSKSNKRYEFEWWGHKYSWKRHFDKQLNSVSFHLIRDGNASAPVAHIVPETRSPSQVFADENAGGWVPPCFMWIADETIVDAITDVADVIMSTGLMALVDDCIKERWQTKKVHHIPVPLIHKTVSFENINPRAIMQSIFGRRHSHSNDRPPSAPSSPLRFANPIPTY